MSDSTQDLGTVGLPATPQSQTMDVAPNLALPWVVRLRYGIVTGEAAVILCMAYVFHVNFPVLWTLAPLLAILASNVALARPSRISAPFPEKTLGAIFWLDTLCLTIILSLTGGPMNPFSLLYLVQITLSAVVLNKFWTWALGMLSTACFGLLFWFHIPLRILETHEHTANGLSPHLTGMWLAFMIAASLITFFTGKISDALRRRELEVLELKDQVAKNERLASLVTLAAGAAHELGTPLGTIAVVARELERYASSAFNDSVREDAMLIRSEVERCRLILERMSVQGAEPMGELPRLVAIADLLNQVRDQFPNEHRGRIHIESHPEVSVTIPKQATIQSLVALIQNALDASSENRPVRVSAYEAGAHVRIAIEDQGCGIPETVLRRVGEPFFTTKEPGKGMGLGTFLVRMFAERLGGRLSFASAMGRGTTVILELPTNAAAKQGYVAV